jgi:hypothetical protein
MKTRTAFTAAVAAVGVTAASFSGIGANQPVATETSTQNPANASATQTTNPQIWHLVIRQALTKAGCENIRRTFPNSSDLKCVGAGKVWVLIPKGMGF